MWVIIWGRGRWSIWVD